VRTPHIRKCACHILAALTRSAAKSSAGRRLRTVAVAVRPKVGAENASSNSTFACEAAVCRRSCSVFTSASAVIKRIAQRGGETVKTEPSMAVPQHPNLPAARNCNLDIGIHLRPQIALSQAGHPNAASCRRKARIFAR
jgi:hypothetical protein